ncbi:hypothetical protein K466DRAFT_19965 [Polyporus arcularius HHB13444]|uniref:Uncharacterized protein n=1 Tax=Polyporus arcularius HHB13444 TaxID=1314778 RepID=A0A5C3PJ74_9APHY|nr:hypothetical protein K466DRAFT_19965 [Polyporus arcularius HHB13444]
MFVTFVHTLSYFVTVQHSHHYQMYIVYTIIHLTYSFCLRFWASSQSYGDHCFRLLSACCDPGPYASISANAIPKRDGAKYVRDHDGSGPAPTTGPDSMRLNNRTTGILQHPISACRKPGHGTLVYHIHMCCQCMRTSRPRNGGAAIVVAECLGRISDELLPSGFRSEISWLYVLLPAALHCDRAAEVQLSWLIEDS